MFKRIALFIIAIVLLLMGAVFLFAEDIQISVSEKEAQSTIDEFLKSENHSGRRVSISPKYISIDFKANDSAQITSEVMLEGYGYTGQFDGEFAAGIDYRRPRLYLDQLSLISGGFLTDDTTQSELNDLKKVATDLLRRQRESGAFEGREESLDISDQSNTELVEEFIVSATKSLFESIPIYDVGRSGKKGMAASLAFKNVHFTEDAAVITLSPVTALLRILSAIGLACLVIAWFVGPTVIRLVFSHSTSPNTNT